MKWPASVELIRHGESNYNALRAAKEADPLYQRFLQAYKNRKADPATAKDFALELINDGSHILKTGDYKTGITDLGKWQAETTGAAKKERGDPLPDVIFVSPYVRTRETKAGLTVGWPELADVRTVEEERIREQEHGLSLLYSDRRIFHAMHPEQEQLHDLEGDYWYRFPQGESVPDVRERMWSMSHTLTRDYAGQRVMMITHHLAILAYIANMQRLDAHGFMNLNDNDKPVNLGVTTFTGMPNEGANGRLVMTSYNEQLYPSAGA